MDRETRHHHLASERGCELANVLLLYPPSPHTLPSHTTNTHTKWHWVSSEASSVYRSDWLIVYGWVGGWVGECVCACQQMHFAREGDEVTIEWLSVLHHYQRLHLYLCLHVLASLLSRELPL